MNEKKNAFKNFIQSQTSNNNLYIMSIGAHIAKFGSNLNQISNGYINHWNHILSFFKNYSQTLQLNHSTFQSQPQR